jgi:AcrR family transcriptional regulator
MRPKQPLSPERIIDVAGGIIDQEGVDALTMRRLAQELDVATTAIYWHVRTRDDLLRGVLERAINNVEIPAVDEIEWDEGLKVVCRALAAVFVHPHIVDLSSRVPSYASFRLFHRMVDILIGAGFSPSYAVESALLLQTYVYGFKTASTRMLSNRESETAMSAESLAEWFRVAGTDGARLLELYLTIDYGRLFERGLEDHITGLRRVLEGGELEVKRPTRTEGSASRRSGKRVAH